MLRSRCPGGQALVECALVLPLVIMLALGSLQVVLYAHAHGVLTSAAQEGARLAAEDGRGLNEGYARTAALVSAGLGSSVEPLSLGGSLDGDTAAVVVDAHLRLILPLPLVTDLPIHAEGHVARERFRPGGGAAR